MKHRTIRVVTKEEFKLFQVSLENEKVYEHEPFLVDELKRFVEEYEEDDSYVQGYFGEHKHPLGLIVFSEQSKYEMFDDDNDDIQYTMVEVLFVHPQHRGKGVGKELVQFAIQESELEWVHANPADSNAWRFFQSIGFQSDKDQIFTNDDWHQFFKKDNTKDN
jgi:GNAT superfamily N-acetyltransferase